eukprot:scaffold56838_cov67-Phaeocystis_antarctica.AAC.4
MVVSSEKDEPTAGVLQAHAPPPTTIPIRYLSSWHATHHHRQVHHTGRSVRRRSRSNSAFVKAFRPEGEPQLGCQRLGRCVRRQLKHVEARGRCWRAFDSAVVALDAEALLLSVVAHEVGKACGRRACRARAEEEQLASLRRCHAAHLGPEPLDLIGARRVATAVLSRGLPIVHVDLRRAAQQQLELGDRAAGSQLGHQRVIQKDA